MPDLSAALDQAWSQPDSRASCSHFAWRVLRAWRPDQPWLNANSLLAWMARSPGLWVELPQDDTARQVSLASADRLILAGRPAPGHGHVVVVGPGPARPCAGGGGGRDGGRGASGHPGPPRPVAAPCWSTSLSRWPGATSRGDKTVRDPWSAADFQGVRFWLLADRGQADAGGAQP